MVDASRGAVPTVPYLRRLFLRLAIAGFNRVILYMEDTYEVEGEPWFGYKRGRYTREDLQELDRAASRAGLELVPGLQMLGHLEQVLQWPRFSPLRDTRGTLLSLPVGDDDGGQVTALLRSMLRSAVAGIRGRRVHLGMDEAFGLGTGGYAKRARGGHTILPPEIFAQHLARVLRLCEEEGIQPMLYTDMLFRLGADAASYEGDGGYYDVSAAAMAASTEVARAALGSSGAELVYWSYGHTDVSHFGKMFRKHAPLLGGAGGRKLVLASGIFSWNRFWARLPFAFDAIDAAAAASHAAGVRDLYVCMWQDDGAEVAPASIHAGLHYYAEAMRGSPRIGPGRRSEVQERAEGVFDALAAAGAGGRFRQVYEAARMDVVPGMPESWGAQNLAKWLLWEDPLHGHLSAQVLQGAAGEKEVDLAAHFAAVATGAERAYRSTLGPEPRQQHPLWLAAKLARALEAKLLFRRGLERAYEAHKHRASDGGAPGGGLAALLEGTPQGPRWGGALQRAIAAVEALWWAHRRLWHAHYRPQGWELLEVRYGALLARLEGAGARVEDLLAGRTSRLEELEERPMKPWGAGKVWDVPGLCWARAATPAMPLVGHEQLCQM
mmetsp:Transcript_43867/g.139798  ORF Transcript_43867/g.139798 Transcript_43867/m.139798 type:complete len:608 (+) Transcript_43867:534-2357(+)